jgi:hypothetical protein
MDPAKFRGQKARHMGHSTIPRFRQHQVSQATTLHTQMNPIASCGNQSLKNESKTVIN